MENLLWKPPQKSIIDYINIKHDVYYNIAYFSQKAFALPIQSDYPAAVCGRVKGGRPLKVVENCLQDKLLDCILGQG